MRLDHQDMAVITEAFLCRSAGGPQVDDTTGNTVDYNESKATECDAQGPSNPPSRSLACDNVLCIWVSQYPPNDYVAIGDGSYWRWPGRDVSSVCQHWV